MTIDHTKVPSTQSNFTVLVSLTDPALKTIANGGHVANANGFDIGFYADSGGTIKLKWEVEKYDGTTGTLIAWVKIPSVSNTTDTVFYLMYGDSSINTNQSDPVNTWDTNFKAVYHFGNGTTLTATDSTGGNNGILLNGPTASVGKINGAAHFVHSSNQAIGLANPADFPSCNSVDHGDMGEAFNGRECRSGVGRNFQQRSAHDSSREQHLASWFLGRCSR